MTEETSGKKTADLCVRCGHCNPVCPTYIEFANEGMGGRGRLELAARFLAGEIVPSERLERLLFSCLMCGACDRSCPRGISVTGAIYEARRKLAFSWSKSRPYSSSIKYACSHPAASYGVLYFLDQAGLLPFLSGFRPFRAIKELGLRLPEERFKHNMSVFRPPEPRGRVALFTGCTVDFLYPRMGVALIEVLNSMNLEVVLSKKEICCGAPLLNMGFRYEAERLAEKNLNIFGKLQVDAVISLCPTCAHFIKDVYHELLGEGIANATDVLKFIFDSGGANDIRPYLADYGNIMFHDPCHSVNYLDSVREPRKILRALGANLAEPSEQGCCGMNGVVGLTHKDVSEAMCRKRASAFESADMVVTSCPNCVMQLGHLMKKKPVKHIIELVNEGIINKRG